MESIVLDKVEKDHVLNEKQKELKAKIMTECMIAMFENIKNNVVIFNNLQELLDIYFSVLVMFNREILVNIFETSGTMNQRGKVMRSFFEAVQKEVNLQLKEKKENQHEKND